MDAAAQATRGLQGMPPEFTARVSQLLEAMRSIGTGLDLHTTLDRIAETAAELVQARYASIVVIDSVSGDLDEFASFGVDTVDRERLDEIPEEPGTSLSVPIEVDGENFGEIVLSEKADGGTFTGNDLQLVRVIATEAGIAIGNARLYEASRQQAHWINGANAVTTALLSSADAKDALQVVAEQARTLADAAAGVVLLPMDAEGDGEGGLEIVAAAGEGTEDMVGTVVPWYSPVAAKLAAGEAVFVDDSAHDPRMITKVAQRFGPSMMLPMVSGARVLGTLAIPRAPGAPLYTAAEKNLARRFASQAALALVIDEAQRDRERLAVYEDRDRIARDLHDLVIQRLFATGMMLQGARRSSVVESVQDRLDKAVDELDKTIQEIRTAIYSLQQEPSQVATGLRALVLREVATAAAPLGFQPSTSFVGAVDAIVDDDTGRHLLAALREALSNAFRHARASQIGVSVDATARLPDGRHAVRLTVADDGVGIPAEGTRRSGLRNIEARAESLGGSAWTAPGLGDCGGGTSVVWQVPVSLPDGE
ncbi:GAF domain-containing protein [Streptomyces sp. A7024]|uniref:GAF domain-containing protein n=2 Tax=Streptomyces coryli TaxID=1128680 RepID=A0A6G4UEP3_9ACTN|nr:GAF domain-containing protein [Streptomyces coryli]